MQEKTNINQVIKEVRVLSFIVILFGLLIFVVIGSYWNPTIVKAYENSEIEIPKRMLKFVKYGEMELLSLWLTVSIGVVIKDYFFTNRFVLLINIILLVAFVTLIGFYPVAINVIHLP